MFGCSVVSVCLSVCVGWVSVCVCVAGICQKHATPLSYLHD